MAAQPSKQSISLSLLVVTLLGLVLTNSASGQTVFGTIVGNATDPSQGAVPDVNVTITNEQTGIARQTRTDEWQLHGRVLAASVLSNQSRA